MKTKPLHGIVTALALGLSLPVASSQSFDSGSDGSMGALNVTTPTTLDMPPDGIFKFTTIAVNSPLRFNRNSLNTPVYLLATGDVVINALIDVSGSRQLFSQNGGAGGPGGFDGGFAGGDGLGPGAGRSGASASGFANSAGGGGYAIPSDNPGNTPSTNNGMSYGSPLLVPIVGGSGGGGSSYGGGGGGGAIVIASNTRIDLPNPSGVSWINANGADSGANTAAGGGSGGAIRLVAPVVSGRGWLTAVSTYAGFGRVRVDTIDRTGVAFFTGGAPFTLGSFMTVFPPGNPRLDVVEAAGTVIPEGTNAPVSITLPFGSNPNRNILVQARNLGANVPIEVVLTPQLGPSIKVQTSINNLVLNPATVTVPVTFPINTPVAVSAWIR